MAEVPQELPLRALCPTGGTWPGGGPSLPIKTLAVRAQVGQPGACPHPGPPPVQGATGLGLCGVHLAHGFELGGHGRKSDVGARVSWASGHVWLVAEGNRFWGWAQTFLLGWESLLCSTCLRVSTGAGVGNFLGLRIWVVGEGPRAAGSRGWRWA